jgi:ATP diphosphatase
MAEERHAFAFPEVVQAITEKLIRRHPHVFGDSRGLDTGEVNVQWDAIKAEERAAKAARTNQGGHPHPASQRDGALAGVAAGLPALTRALKLQQKAGKVGFDWNDPKAVLAKIREETQEIEAELESGKRAEVEAEIGDLMFAVVNLARHLDIDTETALRTTNLKFERRFGSIEDALAAQGKTPQDATLDEMDALWNAAKAAEKNTPPS